MTQIKELTQTLNSWIRRARLGRAMNWMIRGLVIGSALSLILGWLGLYQARLLRNEFLALVSSVSVFVSLVAGLTAYLWRIPSLKAARHFDILLHLEERVSTALELNQYPAYIPNEIIQRQFEDAVSASRRIDPRRDLPFRVKIYEGILALIFILLIGLTWTQGESFFKTAQQARAVQEAVEEQTTKIEEIIKQIEANDALTEEQKQNITTPLNEALKELEENPSLESSVSTLSSTGEKLQALSSSQSQEMSDAFQQAGNELSKQEGSPLQSAGEQLAQGNNVSAASELQNIDVSKLSQAQQEQLAEQLESMADAVRSSNPQLANELDQAASALRSGDEAAAQQALNNAANSLSQAGQQIIYSQIASQAASQVQQGASQVLAAGGGGQGNQQAQNGGESTAQGSNQGQQANGAGGSGSGSGEDAGTGQQGNEADSSPIPQNNKPGDGGESSYEQIYAPTLLGGEEGEQVNLPSSGEEGSDVTGEGQTTPGEQGQSIVPYNEVYSQYEEINHQAIENGEIPSQFMQIIRNYFDSLKP